MIRKLLRIKKTSILDEKQTEFYTETTDKWLEEAEITEDKKVLKTLELKDNHKFVIGTTAEPQKHRKQKMLLRKPRQRIRFLSLRKKKLRKSQRNQQKRRKVTQRKLKQRKLKKRGQKIL